MPLELAVHPDTDSDTNRQVGEQLTDGFPDRSQCFQQATPEGGPAIRVAELRANTPGICHYINSSW